MNPSPSRSRARSVVAALAVSAIALAGTATLIAATTPALAAPAALGVEDEGAACPVTLPGTTTANSRLPDPFRKLDGTRISAKSEWQCRREEIKKLAERYVYGTKPARPATVTGTVTSSNITVNVSDNGRSASFSASVSLPSGTGPFPAVVVVGGLGADTATIRAAGVAVISYDPLAVGREGTPRNNKQGAFYSVYGNTSSTGLLLAWGWGVSRIIDVVEQSGGGILKADAMGVTGCSRYGKGAFVAGAFDQRIALTMPIESGSAGAPIFRGIPGESGAQPLSSAYSEQPWLGDAFSPFTGNPNSLPIDTHQIIGMVAPRGLFLMENPRIDWLAARSGSVAALGGAEIYKALGAGANITYWSDVADGTHCAVRSEWRTPLQQHLQKFLLKTGNAAGTIRISSLKSGNLADWRDWTTPTLTDTTPTAGPPSSPPPSSPPPSIPPSSPPPSVPPSSPPPSSPPPVGACGAAFRTVNTWPGGFQGEVTVTAGASAINGWTVTWTLAGGQTITQLWNGALSTSGSAVTVRNLSWNGSLGARSSTTFGFTGTGSAAVSGLTCTSP
ncbi:cellulose binding domain-containing protein [Catellatospora sp. NPDC049609]|uniref:glucuronyl esterase domain-containing protein n=1 Tax=Catellatospora sp. NPDC049609 TaxID=3155505 RepID=UPI00342CAC34